MAVADENVPADKKAHVVTNGAGAVKELKEDQGTTIEAPEVYFYPLPNERCYAVAARRTRHSAKFWAVDRGHG